MRGSSDEDRKPRPFAQRPQVNSWHFFYVFLGRGNTTCVTYCFSHRFVTLGTLSVIEAGPPLICHPYSIGGAKSLPWGDGSDWNNPAPSYNVTKLANDTFGLLDETTPVLVRMETLRRATLYGAKDHDQARALLARLAERVKAAEESTKSSASALFDYGYFLSSLYQVAWLYKEAITGGIDGYAIVTKALVIDPSSPEMHFAAAP